MNVQQLNIMDAIREGEILRDAGILQAQENADKKSPRWSEKVYELFTEWAVKKGSGHRFKTEDFRLSVELTGKVSKPPSRRAYGSIAVKAVKAGLIKKVGYAQVSNPLAHRANCVLWQVV